jgi:hypothetical protein
VTPEQTRLARCNGRVDIDFFPGQGQTGELARAQAFCRSCPVIDACAELGRNEVYGVWGGSSPMERQRARRHRSRQPKTDAVRAYVRSHREATFGAVAVGEATGVSRQIAHESLRRMEREGLIVLVDETATRGKRWRWKG